MFSSVLFILNPLPHRKKSRYSCCPADIVIFNGTVTVVSHVQETTLKPVMQPRRWNQHLVFVLQKRIPGR